MSSQRASHHRNTVDISSSNILIQYVARRNYPQLKWKENYTTYYHRNWTQETNCYLNTLCNCNTKKYLQQRCKCQRNWNWYLHQIYDPQRTIVPLSGHTTCDIGNKFITIGTKTRNITTEIDVNEVSKDFTKCSKLKTFGNIPCCRFAHTSNYIPPLNAILIFGGFDSKTNFNDAKLLMLDDSTWYNLVYDTDIDFRAYHSTATRITYDHHKQQNVFECYIFGGQWCNGGPYIYHNTLFKFSFYCGTFVENDEKENVLSSRDNGWFNVDEIQYIGDNAPSPRSQCFSFVKDSYFYVFGGCDEGMTLNDLWRFDLNTKIWDKIQYKGPLYAPVTHEIKAINFRVFPAKKPCYYDNDRLIVVHNGALSDIQRQYIKYSDTLYEFQQRSKKLKKTSILNKKFPCTIFTFDLREQQWDIIKTMEYSTTASRCTVPPEIPLTCFVRVGQYLVMVGGGKSMRASNYLWQKIQTLCSVYVLKIPLYGVKNTVSWNRERLLWIGHYKNNEKCFFYKCPKQIIHVMTDFLNAKPNYQLLETSNNGLECEYEDGVLSDPMDDDTYALLQGVETLMGYASSNDVVCDKGIQEPQLINTVLREDDTDGREIKFVIPKEYEDECEGRNNVVTLMGYTGIETKQIRMKSVETLMGFTNSTKQ